jgi:hypothetical protein
MKNKISIAFPLSDSNTSGSMNGYFCIHPSGSLIPVAVTMNH